MCKHQCFILILLVIFFSQTLGNPCQYNVLDGPRMMVHVVNNGVLKGKVGRSRRLRWGGVEIQSMQQILPSISILFKMVLTLKMTILLLLSKFVIMEQQTILRLF